MWARSTRGSFFTKAWLPSKCAVPIKKVSHAHDSGDILHRLRSLGRDSYHKRDDIERLFDDPAVKRSVLILNFTKRSRSDSSVPSLRALEPKRRIDNSLEGNADHMLSELVRVAKPGGYSASDRYPIGGECPTSSRAENQSANSPRVRRGTGVCQCQSVSTFSSGRTDAHANLAAVCRLCAAPHVSGAVCARRYSRRLNRRGNTGVARRDGASGNGRDLFYCAAVSLRCRNKARDDG